MKSKEKILKNNSIKFECQGSGNCCVSRGSYGYVYLSLKDRKKLANFFGLSVKDFINKYCSIENNYYHLKETKKNGDCIFLENNKCNVYKSRPIQCRTWPFWEENMGAKKWKKNIVNFCPGVGKGRSYKIEDINKIVLKDNINESNIKNGK